MVDAAVFARSSPAHGNRHGQDSGVAAELADRPRLAALMISEAWRRVRRRLRIGPLHRWRFAGSAPDRLLVTPPELRRGDPIIAADI